MNDFQNVLEVDLVSHSRHSTRLKHELLKYLFQAFNMFIVGKVPWLRMRLRDDSSRFAWVFSPMFVLRFFSICHVVQRRSDSNSKDVNLIL